MSGQCKACKENDKFTKKELSDCEDWNTQFWRTERIVNVLIVCAVITTAMV